MNDMVEIVLCMGSSCFARGNNRLLPALEDMIRRNEWEAKVSLSGSRCESRCGDGPNVTVDGILYHGMDVAAIEHLLEARLGHPSPA